jgi:ATP-dependent Clp protease ATP-binding subunit ClpA
MVRIKNKSRMCDHGYDATFGARPLNRLLQQKVLKVISYIVIEGILKDNSVIKIDLNEKLNILDFYFKNVNDDLFKLYVNSNINFIEEEEEE